MKYSFVKYSSEKRDKQMFLFNQLDNRCNKNDGTVHQNDSVNWHVEMCDALRWDGTYDLLNADAWCLMTSTQFCTQTFYFFLCRKIHRKTNLLLDQQNTPERSTSHSTASLTVTISLNNSKRDINGVKRHLLAHKLTITLC